ncbi:MAG: Fur family transcriptional regulator [Pseudomonadota bacterium]
MTLTANQQYVLTALREASNPLSAYALLEQLRKPGFSAPAQVYRALDKLIEHGLAYRLETLNAYVACSHQSHCERNLMAFAICDTCGQADEFEVNDGDLRHWAKSHAFDLERTVIEIRGRCATCARHRNKGAMS